MNTKKTFIFYNDWVDYLSEMTLEEKGMFLQAILDYQNGIDVVPEWCIKFIWGRVKNQLDSDRAKWEEVRKKRIDAGKLGWISKWKQMLAHASKCLALPSNAKHTQANQAVNVNVNVNDNVNDNVNVTTTSSQQLFREFKKFYPKPCGWDPKEYISVLDTMVDEDRRNLIRDVKIEYGKVVFWVMERRYVKDPLVYLNAYAYSEDKTIFELWEIVRRLKSIDEEELWVFKSKRKKFKTSVWDDFVNTVWRDTVCDFIS